MRKFTKVMTMLCVCSLLCGLAGCSDTGTPGPDDPGNGDGGGDSPMTEFVARKKQEMPTAEIVDKDYNYGDPSGWASDKLASVDLGHIYLQDVIEDNVYDWGHSVIKEGDTYKMWWCRPAFYDAIFYAESKDLKNWTNVQRVICFSPNQTNVKKYDNIKGMLGKPSVVKVDGTYYMYFEAPASEDPDVTATVLEWDNQVMLATSTDGIHWELYADVDGEPQPVIAMPSDKMGDSNNKYYGVGQPSVFYKDGMFHLTYCYVIGDVHEIRVATSADGRSFGNTQSHTRISSSNGRGVTYNTKTQKYMMVGDKLWESDTLDFADAEPQEFASFDTTTVTTSFYEFVRNEHGLVDTETFYVIHQYGTKSPDPDDWRVGHETWDGYIHAVNPKEYGNRTITLPNGGADTQSNRAEYRDRSNVYTQPEAEAIYVTDDQIAVDGAKDAAYDDATRIEVVRPVYSYGSNLTDSWAEAWVAWNEDYLYVFANVYDKTPNTEYDITSNPMNSFMHDSFDVMVDTINDHGENRQVAYGIEQFIVCSDSAGGSLMIKSPHDTNITGDFKPEDRRFRTETTKFGYTVEFRLKWYEFAVDGVFENAVIGMDFQVNDAMGNTYGMGRPIGREAMVVWSDHTGNSFQYLDSFGDVRLVKKA